METMKPSRGDSNIPEMSMSLMTTRAKLNALNLTLMKLILLNSNCKFIDLQRQSKI